MPTLITRLSLPRGAALVAIVLTGAAAARAAAIDQGQAIKLSRQFLASDDSAARENLSKQLAGYRGDIQPVLDQLSRREFQPVKAGYHAEEHFTDRALRKRWPDDLLYFTVPESYRPDRPTGLIIFLHGGGNTTSRRAPRLVMNFPAKGEEGKNNLLGDVFAATGMIAVGPSAPWNESTSVRWCTRECDDYLADVIAECSSRFNIDPDRVFLIGHSMGGFGAYHHAQRQPDRFAAVVVNAGSWSRGYLPMFRGTPLCIVQGIRDARKGQRWHYTDVAYARHTDKLLTKYKIDHTYYEHDGEHAVHFGREWIAKYLHSAAELRRDPYYPQIVVATPVGFRRDCCSSVKHNRWLTLDKASEGEIEYDELYTNGTEEFDKWRLRHRTAKHSGAAIEAVNRGDNTIAVTTQNVKQYTLWLHPKMVKIDAPVKVIVNGKQRFHAAVKPSLATALESYDRRRDWGLIYPIKIEFDRKE